MFLGFTCKWQFTKYNGFQKNIIFYHNITMQWWFWSIAFFTREMDNRITSFVLWTSYWSTTYCHVKSLWNKKQESFFYIITIFIITQKVPYPRFPKAIEDEPTSCSTSAMYCQLSWYIFQFLSVRFYNFWFHYYFLKISYNNII